MNLEQIIKSKVVEAVQSLFQADVENNSIQLNTTPKDFEGHYTIVVFPFVRLSKKKPEETAQLIGEYLQANCTEVESFNVVKGFCNLYIKDQYWLSFMKEALNKSDFCQLASKGQKVVIEYSSPNTNKPLHLGHIRNNLLGFATAEILKAAGYEVKKVQVVNDRGIHICKSMLAWKRFGKGEMPASSGIKGDHLVGKYYVLFETKFKEEYQNWQMTDAGKAPLNTWLANEKEVKKVKTSLEKKEIEASEENVANYYYKEVYKNTYFNTFSQLGAEARQMLQNWENNDPETVELWKMMNSWVYAGFEISYQKMGVDFDKLYYESETYLVGKKIVEDNLNTSNPIFFKKEDGSTWIDLTDKGLDQKVVLRSDGTSMYITQDLGTATLRFQDFGMDKMIYVVGNEQDYHFQVLFETLARLGLPFANNCHHLSYGMVNLTTGKMKSREGTVVDADDLIEQLVSEVRNESEERATLDSISTEEQESIWTSVALGALKFYILKVEPSKTMIFDPKTSIDLQGQTGPYVQNAHVRTQSVQRAFIQKEIVLTDFSNYILEPIEKEILLTVHQFPSVLETAANGLNPAEIANYIYSLAKLYHQFWNTVTILDQKNPSAASFRLELSKLVAKVLKQASALIGMQMPDRM